MAENKIIRILQTLVAKSREGEVAWETTRSSSKFLSIYSSVSITIESDETPPEFYSLGVLNDNGVEVDSIQFTESDNYYLIAKELYGLARRKALGIEDLLDTLLNEI